MDDLFAETFSPVGNTWVGSNGTILPRVRGGSDDDVNGAENSDIPTPPPSQDDEFVNDFLKNVDPADRPAVEKYYKDWGGKVTQRIQKVHEDYRPYKNLGVDADTVQKAVQVMNLLQNDPKYVYDILKDQFAEEQKPVADPKVPPHLEGLPESFVAEYLKTQKLTETLAQTVLTAEQREQQKQEDAQLDAQMRKLREQHGEFDEEFVLTKMFHGATPEQAIKAFQDFKSKIEEQFKPKPPGLPSMRGGGVLPKDTADVTTMDNKDIKNLIANALAQAQNS